MVNPITEGRYPAERRQAVDNDEYYYDYTYILSCSFPSEVTWDHEPVSLVPLSDFSYTPVDSGNFRRDILLVYSVYSILLLNTGFVVQLTSIRSTRSEPLNHSLIIS